jgi:radical SAM protein with 4Fe4S-binding SPASM domain
MTRIQIRDLGASPEVRSKVGLGQLLALSDRAFLKDHAHNMPGTMLVAPQLGCTRGLNEHALMIAELLDGTRTLPEIAQLLSWRLGRPLQDLEQACADFIAQLTPYGLVSGSKTRRYKPVRWVRQRTTFSLESVQVVLTHRCNMACIYCSNEEHRQEMTSALCDKVINSVTSMGVTRVGLTGGEPTLHPRFWEIAGELSRNAMAVILYTNGSTLTPQHVERLARSQVFQVCVSIDSLEEGVLKRLGQKQVTSAHLIGLIGDLQDAGVRVRTNTALIPGINCTEAKAVHLYETLGSLNVDARAFCEVLPIGRGRICPPQREVFDVAAMLGRKSKGYQSCDRSEWGDRGEGIRTDVAWHVPQTVCGVGTQLTSIYPDGRVIPCIIMSDIVAGNMTRGSLEDIWESGDGLELFRNKENFESPVCRRCPDWNWCRGGCKAKARMYGGSPDSPDLWSCAVYGHVRRAKRRFSPQRIEAFPNPLPEENN